MKIDLHVHTSERSPCATRTEQQQIEAAIEAGLDGIALTDHDQLAPRDHLRRLNERYAPFQIFTGIEVTAGPLHFVVIGLHDPALETRDWAYPDLLAHAREQGGFVFYAHPYRYKPELLIDIDRDTPDGIEIESINTPVERRGQIQALADRLGMALLRNSDGHHPGGVARFYNTLPGFANSDAELVRLLREMRQPRQQAQPAAR